MSSFSRSRKFNVLLVSPETPHTYWGFQSAVGFVGARAAHVPLPLITVAALLPKEWEIRLVDMNIERLCDEDIRWADVVFLTGMIIQRAAISLVLDRCERLDTPTVVGGPFVSSTPDAPELQRASSLFIGEAEDESAMAALIDDLTSGSLHPRYEASGRPTMGASPVPRFGLLHRASYCALSIQISRGCPQSCDFCNVSALYGKRPRYKSPEQVQMELSAIKATGFRGNIFIVDDNFIGDVKYVVEVLDAMIDWQRGNGFPFLFYTESDIRLAKHEAVARKMVEAGFFSVFIGFESPSQEALIQARKHQNVGLDPIESVRLLRSYGLLVYGGFIVGFDADDEGSFDRLLRFVESCKIDFAMAGMLTAIPGTPLESRLRKEGRVVATSEGDSFELSNIIPKLMSRVELLRGYATVIKRLYTPSRYFDRALGSIKEWRQGVRWRFSWREVMAVPKSMLRQGVLSSYRFAYWRFLFRVMLHDPFKIPRAFAQAISGHHFFQYTRKVVLPRLQQAEAEILKSVPLPE